MANGHPEGGTGTPSCRPRSPPRRRRCSNHGQRAGYAATAAAAAARDNHHRRQRAFYCRDHHRRHRLLRPRFILCPRGPVASQLRGHGRCQRRRMAGDQGSIRRRRTRGLDPAALAALPVVPYAQIRKHKSGGGGLECAVCLTAFDDGDELRLLPQCSHAFHPECINPWLEGHVTCPLCRANLEKPVPPPTESPLPSPEKEPPQTPEAISVRVDAEDGEERKEEAVELEKLRCARRAARMPRSRSISATAAAETGDHERFTVRLPPHVREEVLRSRRLRHATSLVITLGGGGASDCPGSSTACSAGGERCVRRRWASLLSRTASWSWAQGGGEASSGKKGVGPEAGGTRRPPCGHVVCSLAARWPARCKAKISP